MIKKLAEQKLPTGGLTRLLFSAVLLWTPIAVALEPASPVNLENIALGAAYSLWPAPNYSYSTDPDDSVQLTDGRSTSAHFWTQKGTVGWSGARYATISVDLGRVEPISGVSLTTAAGTAGVTWPAAVYVLASDDGKSFRNAGDLVSLDHQHRGGWPDGYAIRRLLTTELATRGRYVRFLIVPLPGSPYMFVDEVEVFRGPAELLDRQPSGAVTTAARIFTEGRITRSVEIRFQRDIAGIRQAIDDAILPDKSTRERLLASLERACRGGEAQRLASDPSFQAVLPLDARHAGLFAVQADLWRSLGRKKLSVWVPPAWDPLDPFAVPPQSSSEAIEVHTMRGEYRSAAFNLANGSARPMKVQIRLEGLPDGPAPGYVTLHEVAWTDTAQSVPVAAALPVVEPQAEGWTVSVPPGLVRQVWLTFHLSDVAAGRYAGRIAIDSEGAQPRAVPIRLRVWPFDFPQQTTLWLGGWSYTNGSSYGITPQNRGPLVEHLKQHFVNAPWATSGLMRKFEFDAHNPERIRLDCRDFDQWMATWPDARAYLVFLSVANHSGAILSSFGGEAIGTPAFDRRVRTWITAWVDHLKSKGVSPGRLGLLIHDEPHEGSDVGAFLAWSKAIRAAQPEVLVWEDPTYRNPRQAPPELFDACDVLCPNRPMWLAGGEPFATFYRRQRERGRRLQFYSCSGPARLLDPYAYYRLQAWQCWQMGATGSYFWAFGDNGGCSSWNEYGVSRGPFTPLFLDDTTVTAGKQMEAIRESVEDYEYFVMLEKAVHRAKAAGRSGPAVSGAEALLQTAAGRVLNAEDADQLKWHAFKDRTVADTVRVEILDALTSLE